MNDAGMLTFALAGFSGGGSGASAATSATTAHVERDFDGWGGGERRRVRAQIRISGCETVQYASHMFDMLLL